MKRISIKDVFIKDRVTREAGEKLRQTILSHVMEDEKVEIDFSDTVIASTSFFDEAFAKLVEEGWDKKMFETRIKIINMNENDAKVLKHVCKYRGL